MLEQNLSPLLQVLIALITIILVTRIGSIMFKKMGQPAVMGEIIGGILLGPSFLGLFFPRAAAFLLPPAIAPQLNIIAQTGIIFYMFLVGLEVDLNEMKTHARSTVIISSVSIIVPFCLGLILSKFLYHRLAPVGLNQLSFSLFVGVSLSITAFPVLARILTDQNLHKTNLGKLALSCAAIDDISAWCILALVMSFTSAKFNNALMTITLTVLFICLMLFLAGPLIKKNLNFDSQETNEKTLAMMLISALLCAFLTELIGIHALFGAFLLGAIFPHNHSHAKNIHYRLNDFIRLFFLPIFFAFIGMRTKINLVSTTEDWVLCAVIITVAILGKFGGTFIAARISGHNAKDSASLGILMNTRGLVELIVLNVGLDKGILTPELYTMLVIMALVTTLMTGPLMKLQKGNTLWEI